MEKYYFETKNEIFGKRKVNGKNITNIELEEDPNSFDITIKATHVQCINKTIIFRSLTSSSPQHSTTIERYFLFIETFIREGFKKIKKVIMITFGGSGLLFIFYFLSSSLSLYSYSERELTL